MEMHPDQRNRDGAARWRSTVDALFLLENPLIRRPSQWFLLNNFHHCGFLVCFADCRDQNFDVRATKILSSPHLPLAWRAYHRGSQLWKNRPLRFVCQGEKSVYLNLWQSACCCATSARQTESPGATIAPVSGDSLLQLLFACFAFSVSCPGSPREITLPTGAGC
jgi:hypothetical protein